MLVIIYSVVAVLLLIVTLYKRWYLLSCPCYLGFIAVCFAIMPLPGEERQERISPTQIVFRFDEYRYLQLTGSGCRGKLYYIDEQKQVYYELAVHSARVLTEPFAHTVGDYIFVPYEDYSGSLYSQNGGRTFKKIDISPFADIHRERREQIKGTVVVNNQLFMDTTSGIYRSPKPFGSHIAVEVLSPQEVKKWMGGERYAGARWRGDITKMPHMPDDYKGWYHWQCDVGMKQYERIYNRYEPLHNLQARRHLIGLNDKREQ
jgi:hypothetical protein